MPARQYLLDLLNKYVPAYSEELVYKQQILEFVNLHENCFSRSCQLGHITASSLLLNKNKTKALLMHHSKLDIWAQLGGHCDEDPDVLQVAIKEAQEESGINNIVPISKEIFDIDIHLIPPFAKDLAHYHYDIRFILKVNSDESFTKNNESKELRWCNQDGSNLPTDNLSILRLFKKWKSL